MKEQGVVVLAGPETVRVRMKAKGSCQNCAGKTACKVVDRDHVELEVEYSGSVQEGDLVEIELSPGKTVLSSFLIFGVPLAGAVFGYWVGIKAAGVQGGGVGGSMLGLAGTFSLVWVLYRFVLTRVWFHPKVVKIIKT